MQHCVHYSHELDRNNGFKQPAYTTTCFAPLIVAKVSLSVQLGPQQTRARPTEPRDAVPHSVGRSPVHAGQSLPVSALVLHQRRYCRGRSVGAEYFGTLVVHGRYFAELGPELSRAGVFDF